MPPNEYPQRDPFVEAYGDTLIYELPYLHPEKYYLLRVIPFLAGTSTSNLKLFLTIDGLKDTLISCKIGTPETLDILLPKELYKDTKVLLKLISLSENDVYLPHLVLYQFDILEPGYGIGGPMASETQKPRDRVSLEVFPNLIKGVIDIRYEISDKSPFSLKVYDASGRLVRTLTRAKNPEPKAYTLKWDGRDDRGRLLPKGVYFIRLDTQIKSLTEKVVMIK